MHSLIVGYGEVGQALWNVLNPYYRVGYVDKEVEHQMTIKTEIMHICFPYSDTFIESVKNYQKKYEPKFTVIHSTVPVGTSRACDSIHSPIRGVHPNLEQGIRTFPKFLGGEKSSEVADYFRKAGVKVILFDKQETTEALKLWDTQYYLECVRFCKRVKDYCDKNDLNFTEVYTLANQTYNEGYAKLGMSEVCRPVLQPIMTEVGGHCLIPNEKLLYED